MSMRQRILAMTAGLCLCVAAHAGAAQFTISWVGSNGYSMSGSFSFADALLGTGAITEVDLDTFAIEAFLNDTSVGTWNLATGYAGYNFNFNFDTTTQEFIVGGFSSDDHGQEWNVYYTPGEFHGPNPGIGFFNGSSFEALMVNGSQVGQVYYWSVPSGSHLTATPVPEPASLLLLGTGLAGLAARFRKRR